METKKLKTLEEAELNVVLFDNDNVVATSGGGCTLDSGCTGEGCDYDGTEPPPE